MSATESEAVGQVSMQFIVNIALVLSVLAFLPSAAAFTPSIVVSGIAALVAVVAVRRGFPRRGLLAIYFSTCAFLMSPMAFDIELVDKYLVAMPVFGLVCAIVMYWDYRRGRNVHS
jgi:hypothetical protein